MTINAEQSVVLKKHTNENPFNTKTYINLTRNNQHLKHSYDLLEHLHMKEALYSHSREDTIARP